jgi:soluble lytic murein transglycosylase-like protein
MRALPSSVLTSILWLSLLLCQAQANATDTDPRCQTLQSAALANGLPREFLTRLIWQESRFNEFAISRAGAQGIAQFMPATATDVKLANPFDAITAINKSAELLHSLNRQFGNLGLAAAAYNAGPKRVSDWLVGRRRLPQETVHYVPPSHRACT